MPYTKLEREDGTIVETNPPDVVLASAAMATCSSKAAVAARARGIVDSVLAAAAECGLSSACRRCTRPPSAAIAHACWNWPRPSWA